MEEFSHGLPKAELHLHIEGTLEPELMFELARRNDVKLAYPTVEAIREAYAFTDLQSFLDIYYQGASVLQREDDFRLMTLAYLEKAAAQGVRRAEIFFDPQTHTDRGIPYNVVLDGIGAALVEGRERLGISSGLILCFLRHLSPAAARTALELALPRADELIGVGLDSSEIDRPPALFEEVFGEARRNGLHTVAHAGEEGPPAYVVEALDILGAERIDHGVRSLEDEDLVRRLIRDQVPLTVCPQSNIKLRVYESMAEHPLASMLDMGMVVSINSDDPAYFGGYVGDNYAAVGVDAGLDRNHLVMAAKHSIASSFASAAEKAQLLTEIDSFVDSRAADG